MLHVANFLDGHRPQVGVEGLGGRESAQIDVHVARNAHAVVVVAVVHGNRARDERVVDLFAHVPVGVRVLDDDREREILDDVDGRPRVLGPVQRVPDLDAGPETDGPPDAEDGDVRQVLDVVLAQGVEAREDVVVDRVRAAQMRSAFEDHARAPRDGRARQRL